MNSRKSLVALVIILFGFGWLKAQTTHYVKENGAGTKDGSSWENASNDIQLTINNANAGDQIWVANGKYKPNRPADNLSVIQTNRNCAFVLKKDVKLYGGFPATGNPTFADRDTVARLSILSGDLAGNDGANFANNGENAYHVIISAGDVGNTRLDGFTIKGGNAANSNLGYNLIVNEQTISEGLGGAMYIAYASPAITNCTFSANTAGLGGGGVFINSSSLSVTNCTFFANTATSQGGAICCNSAYPVLTKCTLSANTANEGGAIYNSGSSPVITNCLFSTNTANSYGGAIANYYSSSPVITNSVFSANTATTSGGALCYVNATTSVITNCTFFANTANSSGGGISNINSSPKIYNTIILGNNSGINNAASCDIQYSLAQGVAADNVKHNFDGIATTATQVFINSSSGDYSLKSTGPAVDVSSNNLYNQNGRNAATDKDFVDNIRLYGTAIDMGAYEYAPPTLTVSATALNIASAANSTATFSITSNTNWTTASDQTWLTVSDATGIHNKTVTLTAAENTLAVARQATVTVAAAGVSNQTITVTQAAATPILNVSKNAFKISAMDGAMSFFSITSNTAWTVTSNQTWLTANTTSGTLNGTITLTATANTSNLARQATVTVSATGLPDIAITVIQTASLLPDVNRVFYIKEGGTGNGASWANAAGDLQEVINFAAAGDKIWVAKGTYKPNRPANNLLMIDTLNRDNAFVLKSNVKLYGGFPANGNPAFAERDTVSRLCFLSGDLAGNDGANFTGNDENTCHVIINVGVVNGTELNGFTIKGGNANSSHTISVNGQTISALDGGAMVNTSSSLAIANCTFSSNTSYSNGGAMCNNSSSPAITNCTFSGNTNQTGPGGAIYNNSSSPIITNCHFSSNTANTWGGAIYNYNSSLPVITRCMFWANTANTGGGAITDSSSSTLFSIITGCTFSENTANNGGGIYNKSAIITNCKFVKNTARNAGGGMYNSTGSLAVITNCIFVKNTASSNGGGIYNYNHSSPKIYNTIVLENSSGIDVDNTSTSNVQYSLVQGMIGGTNGNLNGNTTTSAQVFTDFSAGNYTLKAGSPCVDVGSNNLYNQNGRNAATDKDLAGNTRLYGANIDMGAYEYAPPSLIVSATALAIAATANSTATFDITSNVNWTATSDQTWLTANPAGGANNYTVTLTATEANPTTATRAATVTITSMGVENKTVTVTQAAGSPTGVNSEKYSVITLYPNPTTNGFTIETEDKPATLTIHTLTGSLVKIQTVSGKTYVDVSDLKAGAYLVKVNGKTAKLVKR